MSSAYYAVFHSTTEAIAASVLPADADDDQRGRLRRWVPHAKVRTVCEHVTKAAGVQGGESDEPKGFGGQLGAWPMLSRQSARGREENARSELPAYARFFLRLQEARHDADYDHGASFPKSAALTYVAEARRALDLLASHGGRDDFRLVWATIASQPVRG